MKEPITDLDIKILLININNHPARDPGECFIADCIRRMIPELQRLRELETACRKLLSAPHPEAAPLKFQRAYTAIGRLLEGAERE